MTTPREHAREEADRFDEAWRTFVAADAKVTPPADLEQRVLAAIERRRAAPPRPGGEDFAKWAASLAAVVALSITGAWWLTRPPATAPRPAPIVSRVPAVPDTVRDIATPSPGGLDTRHLRMRGRRAPAPALVPAVLMTLDAEPVRRDEALQLIRLRLPREALQALGIALLEPDAGGSVDVDVLIGEDGLPRDIRKVRLIQE